MSPVNKSETKADVNTANPMLRLHIVDVEEGIPGLPVRFSLLIWFCIIAIEGLIAILDRRYGQILPVNYFYILPVLVGGLYLGYLGGIGVPILTATLFTIVHNFLLHTTMNETEILWLLMLIILGTVTAHTQLDRREAKRSARQLERLNRAQEELTALIVHDLRTPLAGVLNVLRLTIEDDRYTLPDSHRQLLELAVATGEEMNGMIGDLLALHTIESGAMELNLESLQAEEVIQSAVRQVAPIAQQRNIEIRTNAEPGLPGFSGDAKILRRVLVNLLGNALRVSPRGSKILVTAARQEGEIAFSVADQGPGIPAKLQQTIFEKFASLDLEAGKHVSTGLGLAFVKLAVKEHGGRVVVESPWPVDGSGAEPGSRFSVILPLSRRL
jgi:signal transduction histidine kinase